MGEVEGASIKNMKSLYIYFCIAIAAFFLVGCHTAKEAGKGKTVSSAKAEKYKKNIMQGELPQTMTARMKLNVVGFGKEASVNGNLRMKRDEVVQLSLSMLGIELGKLEFTPDDVLIVDRFNKQYVRCRYDEVDFLKSAEINFYTLQSVFWNELFVPGKKSVDAEALNRFLVYAVDDMLMLLLKDTPRLSYGFLADKNSGKINRVEVTDVNDTKDVKLFCNYSDFSSLGSGTFPTVIEIVFLGTGRETALRMSLSRLTDSSDWETRTIPSSKYKERKINEVLGSVSKMLNK